MHLRLPAIEPGVKAFVWALLLSLYIWAFMLAVGVDKGTSTVIGLVSLWRDLPLRPRVRRERRVLGRVHEHGRAAASACCEGAHEHPRELASDRLFEATESGRSGVVDLGQDSAEEFVSSLALR